MPTPGISARTETGASDGAKRESESAVPMYAEDAQLGDEYISLTFHESESEDEEEEEEDEEEQQEDEEDAPSDGMVPAES